MRAKLLQTTLSSELDVFALESVCLYVTCCLSIRMVFGELSPAAAVVGGVLAQEIIKAVSHKDMPIRNYFFFNGLTDRTGLVEAIGF